MDSTLVHLRRVAELAWGTKRAAVASPMHAILAGHLDRVRAAPVDGTPCLVNVLGTPRTPSPH